MKKVYTDYPDDYNIGDTCEMGNKYYIIKRIEKNIVEETVFDNFSHIIFMEPVKQ